MIKEIFSGDNRFSVETFSGLLVDFVREKKAQAIIRGLRAVSDFEFEIQVASMNAHLCPEAETVFLMASEDNLFVSSSIIKEIALLGGGHLRQGSSCGMAGTLSQTQHLKIPFSRS